MARIVVFIALLALIVGCAEAPNAEQSKGDDLLRVMDQWLAHVVAQEDDQARKMTDPDTSVIEQIPHVRELDGYKQMSLLRAYANDEEALAICSPTKQDGQIGYLVIRATLGTRESSVVDLDFRTPDELSASLGDFLLRKSNIRVVRD